MKPINGTFWYVLKHCPIQGTHVPAFLLPGMMATGPINTVDPGNAALLKKFVQGVSTLTGDRLTIEELDITGLPNFIARKEIGRC